MLFLYNKGKLAYFGFGMAGIIYGEIFPIGWIFFPKIALATQNLKELDFFFAIFFSFRYNFLLYGLRHLGKKIIGPFACFFCF